MSRSPTAESVHPVVDGKIAMNASDRVEAHDVVAGTSINYFDGFRAHFRQAPVKFMKQIGEYATGHGWQSYEEYIGQEILYPTCGISAVEKLLASQRVTRKIDQVTASELATAPLTDGDKDQAFAERKRQLQEHARSLAIGLCTQMSDKRTVRAFMCTVHIILARLYHEGVHIPHQEYQVFRQAAEEAAKRKQTLLLLPNHKSYIDPMIVTWLMYRLGHSLPVCIASQSLNIPIVGTLLKKTGGMFIKRPFGDDPLYPELVKEYIEQILSEGLNMEIFIEGTRSRTGKLLPPKVGMLKYIIDAVQAGRTTDVIVCPVSIQYSNILELDTFSNELLGVPKVPESLGGLVFSGGRALQRKLGKIAFRFQNPFSLKDFVAAHSNAHSKPTVAPGGRESCDETALLKSFAYRVLSDINTISPVVPVAVVAAILLSGSKRGLERSEFICQIERLKVALAHKRIDNRSTLDLLSATEILDQSLTSLGEAVKIHHDSVGIIYLPIKLFALALHRNQMINHFAAEGFVAVALKHKSATSFGAISALVSFLATLLQQEFVYSPGNADGKLQDILSHLSAENVIRIDGNSIMALSTRPALETLDFYRSLISPFIDAYWVFVVTIAGLFCPESTFTPVRWYRQKDILRVAQQLATHLHLRGDISVESANQVTLDQAFTFFESRALLTVQTSNMGATGGLPLVSLGDPNKFADLLARLDELKHGENGQDISPEYRVHTEMLVQKLAPRPRDWSGAGNDWQADAKL